jgi:glyoxylase-like metal-dependent hydrolase (beta-lactamase superfamily II)
VSSWDSGEHIRVEQVADGAWAAIAVPDTGSVGNAGFVEADGATIVFDAHLTPQAGAELRAAAEAVAPVSLLVDSHWHGDHVRGNAAFPAVPIVSSDVTRELIVRNGLPQLDALRSRRGELRTEGTERWVGEALDAGLEQALPTETFAGSRELERGELLELGAGHTQSDVVLWLAEERILFAADLVVVGFLPWLGHGDPENWLRILDRIEELGPERIVPGHGPVGTLDDTRVLRGYIEALLAEPSLPAQPGWVDAEIHERNADFVRSRA